LGSFFFSCGKITGFCDAADFLLAEEFFEFSFSGPIAAFFFADVIVDFLVLVLESSSLRFFAEVDEGFGLRDVDDVLLFALLLVEVRVELVDDFVLFFTRIDPLVIHFEKIRHPLINKGETAK
jgi:hypothetical protein